METIRVVCAHDCPDMCSLLAEVEDGRVRRVRGDPEQPFTAGFACAKVNRDAELVHSPERITTPLRRTGAEGRGPIRADLAGTRRSTRSPRAGKRIIAESGPLALLGYAYSAHQGQMNRGLMLGLFHALGTSRLIAGTVCDTCCEEAWNLTVGPVGGADPEAVDDSDLIIAWGADLVATNVHFWAKAEAARRRGVKLVVDRPAPEPHRAAGRLASADPHRHRRGAGARGHAHPGARRPGRSRLLAAHTLGFDRLEARGAAALRPGARRRDHRARRGRHRGLRRHVRRARSARSSGSARA